MFTYGEWVGRSQGGAIKLHTHTLKRCVDHPLLLLLQNTRQIWRAAEQMQAQVNG